MHTYLRKRPRLHDSHWELPGPKQVRHSGWQETHCVLSVPPHVPTSTSVERQSDVCVHSVHTLSAWAEQGVDM